MKKQSTILFLVAAASIITLQSYKTGTHTTFGNRTGSTGITTGCSPCHGSVSALTAVSVIVSNSTGPVSSYVPGAVYDVSIVGANSSGNPKFGFQLTCGGASTGSATYGTFDLNGTTNTALRASGSLVEHTSPQVGQVANGAATYNLTFKWTAPAAGNGSVKFYAVLNAVNGNNNDDAGDNWAMGASSVLTEAGGTAINNDKKLLGEAFSIFPNPSSDKLTLKLEKNASKNSTIKVVDLTGRTLLTKQIDAGATSLDLNIETLAQGTYQLVLSSEAGSTSKQFVKQ